MVTNCQAPGGAVCGNRLPTLESSSPANAHGSMRSSFPGTGAEASPHGIISPFRVPANHSSPGSRDSSGPHLPAFAVRADSGDSGMMVAPIGLSGDTEFPKNSINFDKFTGFFDKFPKIKLPGNDAADSGRGGILPRPVRPPITANARKCAFLAETPDSS